MVEDKVGGGRKPPSSAYKLSSGGGPGGKMSVEYNNSVSDELSSPFGDESSNNTFKEEDESHAT